MAEKIGEGVFQAYARQGLAELRSAVSFHSSIEQPTDYGMWGVATPGEVAQARAGDGKGLEADKNSTLEDRLQKSKEDQGRDDRDREGPAMDR
jgi:hypothetical protein